MLFFKLLLEKIVVLTAYQHNEDGFADEVNAIYSHAFLRQNDENAEADAIQKLYNLMQRNVLQSNTSPTIGLVDEEKIEDFYETHKLIQKKLNEKNLPSIAIFPYPELPAFTYDSIQANGKLLTEEEITQLKNVVGPQKVGEKSFIHSFPKPNSQEFNHYAIYKNIGSGAFGTAYLVQDLATTLPYVMKRMQFSTPYQTAPVEIKKDSNQWAFQNEITSLAHLNKLVTSGGRISDNYGFMVMDYVTGTNLSELLGEKASTYTWLKRAISSLEALDALHKKGLIHGDFGTHNILCDGIDNASLIDHGASGILNNDIAPHKQIGNASYYYMATPNYTLKSIPFLTKIEIDDDRKITPNIEVGVAGLTLAEMFECVEIKEHFFKSRYAITKKSNLKLSDEDADKLHTLLISMTQDDLGKRPKLENAIEILKDIQSRALELPSRFKKIGCVFWEDIFNDEGQVREEMITPLRYMQKVYIIGDKEALPELEPKFAKHGITLAGIAKLEPNVTRADNLFNLQRELENQPAGRYNINSYFYVTPEKVDEIHLLKEINIHAIKVTSEKTKKDYIKEIENRPLSFRHFMLITENLQKEIKRLNLKYKIEDNKANFSTAIATQRKKVLENLLENFAKKYNKHDLTYRGAITDLENLQLKMMHTNSAKGFFSTLFGLQQNTIGSKKINSLCEKLRDPKKEWISPNYTLKK